MASFVADLMKTRLACASAECRHNAARVTVADLMQALQDHHGKARGIVARHLCARLNIPERAVRDLITSARLEGHPICGTPAHGYYIAVEAAELEQTCQFLRSRAMHSLVLESRLRKVPLAVLLGQLPLALPST